MAAPALVLAACGGEQPSDASLPQAQLIVEQAKEYASTASAAPSPANEAAIRPAPAPAAAVLTARAPQTKKSEPPSTYELHIVRTRGVYGDVGTMIPVRGAGYEPLHALVQLRNRPRHMSAVAGVQPHCATTTRCEYLPPRRDGAPERLAISLNEGSIARLTPVKDMIAITVAQLDVPQPVTVTVTLTVPGQDPVVRRIVYASAETAPQTALAKEE